MPDTAVHARRWPIVLGTIIVQMGLGTIYTWSLFNQPLVNRFGWHLGAVATTFSITSFALAVSALFSGRLEDKWGIRRLTSAAGMTLGMGLILSSFAHSLPMLYLFVGVLVGFADGTAYITTLSNLIRWFPEQKGLISGVTVSAYGLGSLVFRYVNGWLITVFGVPEAFLYWGILTFLLVVAGAQLLRDAQTAPVATTMKARQDYSVTEMLRTPQAYLLFVMFFSACMSGLYLISIARDIGVRMAGLDVATAANVVAMIAVFNTIGRLILGALSDKAGRLRVVAASFLITAVAVLTLSFVPLNYVIFFACVAAIAFCFGGNITVFPAIVGDFFGLKNHTKNYGVIYQGFGLGALAASFIAAVTGGFRPTFIVISFLCVVSLILAVLIRLPHGQRQEAPQTPSPKKPGMRVRRNKH